MPTNRRSRSRSPRNQALTPADALCSEWRMFKICVVIPVYNHERRIAGVIDDVLAEGLPCIAVDDGSASPCAYFLERWAAALAGLPPALRHNVNRGKGSAVLT